MPKILIVDDEQNILDLIEYNLKSNGFDTLCTDDGKKALELVEKENPDLIILDIMLPSMDGFDVVKNLRKDNDIPVLMLTARSDEFDRVLGLELGADDYLTKPFSMRELIARVKAILRRIEQEPRQARQNEIIEGPININTASHKVFVNKNEVQLTAKEYQLLKMLVMNKSRVFTRDELLSKLWGYDYYGDTRTVDVHIRHLREKIEVNSSKPKFLKTVRGVGYKFEV